MTQITPITALSAGSAIQIVTTARAAGIPATYHPHGGHTAKKYTPVTHTVYVEATVEQLRDLRLTIAKVHHA